MADFDDESSGEVDALLAAASQAERDLRGDNTGGLAGVTPPTQQSEHPPSASAVAATVSTQRGSAPKILDLDTVLNACGAETDSAESDEEWVAQLVAACVAHEAAADPTPLGKLGCSSNGQSPPRQALAMCNGLELRLQSHSTADGSRQVSAQGGQPKRPRRVLPSYLIENQRQRRKKQAMRTLGVRSPAKPESLGAIYTSTLPLATVGTDILVCNSLTESAAQCAALLEHAPGGPFGFDIEWKVTFVKGEGQRSTALLQIGSTERVVLFRLCKTPRFPPSLRDLLESPDIVKVGVGIHGDVLKLERDFGVSVDGAVDLVAEAERRLVISEKSLESLCLKVLKKRLPKDSRVRCSDWEAAWLSTEQRMYAALDAAVSLEVYQALLALPVAMCN
eukprot:m.168035 g.168035  ORF g.168035 m.168035 type:complete len:393 (+) comp14741_c0_seq6:174-1352(+)